MIIKNGNLYLPSGIFQKQDLYIREDKIVSQAAEGMEEIDAADCYVIPGLIDIHFHGCKNVDFCDGTKESVDTISQYEAACGITAICPATMTYDEKRLTQICQVTKDYENGQGAMLCGINMEGPYISREKCGAQNPAYIRKPDFAEFMRLQTASGGKIRLVDIAPEIQGAMEFIEAAKEQTHVSIAHTSADYETAMEAFHKGADHVTHLYNAMTGFTHRAPGVVGAAAEDNDCFVELICDGIHIHPSVVRTSFKMFGKNRIVFISDSMEATGMPDGTYELGGQAVKVKGNRATLMDGTIAGSVTNLMNCVKTAVEQMGIPLEDAIGCATANPAKSVGLYEQMGSLEPGKLANVVILEKDLSVRTVFIQGKRIQ